MCNKGPSGDFESFQVSANMSYSRNYKSPLPAGSGYIRKLNFRSKLHFSRTKNFSSPIHEIHEIGHAAPVELLKFQSSTARGGGKKLSQYWYDDTRTRVNPRIIGSKYSRTNTRPHSLNARLLVFRRAHDDRDSFVLQSNCYANDN